MKIFFSINRKTVEIILTLLLVSMAGGYYYLIYIPGRENEIIQRRFRTLRRIETNMKDKFSGYVSTIQNIVGRYNDPSLRTTGIDSVLAEYNANQHEFHISTIRIDSITTHSHQKDTILYSARDDTAASRSKDAPGITVMASVNGRNLTILYDTVFLSPGKNFNKHVRVRADVNYQQFVIPLLRKNVFDHYLVFSDKGDSAGSSIIYEDFPSGISFHDIDSLFQTKNTIYTSKIVTLGTGGEQYLAFLHPCGYTHKNDRIIVGLLKQDTFNKEKKQLPENVVTAILFLVLFCFLLLPVIRLILIGRNERIRFFDLFTAYSSFLLLVPVVVLLFFWNSRYFMPKSAGGADPKKVLADQISGSLFNEVDSTCSLLDSVDSWRYNDSNALAPLVRDTINVRYLGSNTQVHYFDKKSRADSMAIDSARHFLDSLVKTYNVGDFHPDYVFWLDTKSGPELGNEIGNWAFGEDPPRGNYKDRSYFKDARDGNTIALDRDFFALNHHPQKNIAFEPIISRSDGQFKFNISIQSRHPGQVAACPSRLRSVINPVLPMGYCFSITDAEGNTIFDSDTTNNLNENQLEEISDSASLRAVLTTRTSKSFTATYDDEECNVLAQPVGVLPYFIIVCENTSFESSLNTQCFSFTLVMMFSFFVFLCVEIAIIFACRRRPSKLLRNHFDLSWLHPRQSMSPAYLFLFRFNTCLLIVLFLFCFVNFSVKGLTTYLFLFIIAALAGSIAACKMKPAPNGLSSVSASRQQRKKNVLTALAVSAAIAMADSWYYSLQTGAIVLAFSLAATAMYYVLKMFSLPSTIQQLNQYRKNFRLMIFSKLMLTSGFPIIIFFLCSYNFEQRLQERLKLLTYAQQIEQATRRGEKLQSIEGQVNGGTGAIRAFYTDSVWIHDLVFNPQYVFSNKTYDRGDNTCLDLLRTSHVSYNDVAAATENFELEQPYGRDSIHFNFNNILDQPVSRLRYRIAGTLGAGFLPQYIDLSSSGAAAGMIPEALISPRGFIFWVLLVGALAICYQLLKFTINRIYGTYVFTTVGSKDIWKKLISDNEVKFLFVQGIPGTGKTDLIREQMESNGIQFYDSDKLKAGYQGIMFNLEEIYGSGEWDKEKSTRAGSYHLNNLTDRLFERKTEYIVFTHFESKFFDADANKIKLQLLEKLILAGKKKIILVSDIDPMEFLKRMHKIADELSENNHKKSGATSKSERQQTHPENANFAGFLHRWTTLLGRFTTVHIDDLRPSTTARSSQSPAKKFLATECSRPLFLMKYQPQVAITAATEEAIEDSILKIQSLADQSYRKLWNSLTKEEQVTLYDLAEDGLVNTANSHTINILLNKGLMLDKDGYLVIVNRSFRNFILTIVKHADLKSMEKKVSGGVTWNDYKYPVLIILAALVYFVFYSNPEKFGNVLPLISGLMAGVPTVLKLLSYLKPSDNKN